MGSHVALNIDIYFDQHTYRDECKNIRVVQRFYNLYLSFFSDVVHNNYKFALKFKFELFACSFQILKNLKEKLFNHFNICPNLMT